jgi:type VI secretion system protein
VKAAFRAGICTSPTPAMFEERLTERIRGLGKGVERSSEKDPTRVISSVINHLQRLLNTRQGSVPIADDYGMPDFTSYLGENLNDQSQKISEMIRNMILKYEPRLNNVHVVFTPDKDEVLSLRFKLQAEIVNIRDEKVALELETVISSDGKIRVSQ